MWALVLFSNLVLAQTEHNLLRRVTVFPVKAPAELSAAAEESWWQIREVLTENKRFLVASKNFLIQKDVYQARGDLSPADAIILGKLLDANALVVTWLEGRTFKMRVFEGEFGRVLWQAEVDLHASQPLSSQLPGSARKLIYDFIASIPYQGFVTIDPLRGEAAYKEGKLTLVRADVGLNSKVEVGDPVQFIRLFSDSLRPLFSPDTTIEIFADGKVIAVDREFITVELQRMAKKGSLKEATLVRLPNELKRLKDLYKMTSGLKMQIQADYLSPEITPLQQEVEEKKPLVASLTFILNLATFLLLAF